METIYVMANIVYKNCVLFQIEIKKKNGTVLNTDRAESDQLTLLLNKLYIHWILR